ncbi:MAG: hypothetical protein ACI4MP_06840 [Candidatus Ventricola sp.]
MSTTIGKVRPVFRGEWDPEAAYAALDMVRSADGQTSYTALKDVPAGTALSNATYWDRIVDVTAAVDRITAAADSAARPLPATAADNPAQIWPDADSVLRPVTALAPVQSGSGDPSPDNVRPISGRTSVQLTRCGKNLLENTAATQTADGVTFTVNADGSVTANGTASATTFLVLGKVNIKSGATYAISGCPSGGSSSTYSLSLRNKTGSVIYKDDYGNGGTYTPSSDVTAYCRIRIQSGVTVSNLTFYPQLELGSTVTEFEPYTGATFAADFGQTVYGGTLDWNTGVLTVDMVSRQYMPTTISSYGSAGYSRFTMGIPSSLKSVANDPSAICDRFKRKIQWNIDSEYFYANDMGIYLFSNRWSTLEDAQAWFTDNPTMMVYRLATPATIQLTPQQITALPGLNTVFDDGDGLTVGYNKSIARMFEEVLALVTAAGGE